jgi:hypothetical protein
MAYCYWTVLEPPSVGGYEPAPTAAVSGEKSVGKSLVCKGVERCHDSARATQRASPSEARGPRQQQRQNSGEPGRLHRLRSPGPP